MSKRPLATVAEGLPSPTISQRVNAIFAAYVATEAEQHRLGALNTPQADAQADKLGDTALSLAKDLESVIDFDANPDLLAARALHELMLAHPWSKLGSFEWRSDDREPLLTVSLVANATTGAVREQVRRVMRTKGIEIAEAPAASDELPGGNGTDRFPCPPDIAALRTLIGDAEDDMRNVFDYALLLNESLAPTGPLQDKTRGALLHLSGALLGIGERLAETHDALHDAIHSAASTPPAENATACPMEALIADYDRASNAYDAIRSKLGDDDAQQLYDATIEPVRSRMFEAPPAIATRKGAADALRLVLNDPEFQDVERSLTNAVLAYAVSDKLRDVALAFLVRGAQ